MIVLIIHIVVALLGIVSAGYAVVKPSQSILKLSASAVVATLLSGTYLVLAQHLSLTSACFSGLSYLAVTLSLLTAAKLRLDRASY